MFYEIFYDDQCVTGFSLLIERAGEAEFQCSAIRCQTQTFTKFFLGFGTEPVCEQRFGKVLSKREIIRRKPQRFPQRLQGIIRRGILRKITHVWD